MTCFHPVDVWPAAAPKRGVVWSAGKSYPGAVSFKVPCNQCIGCRLDKARDWATRMHHEASLHSDNVFVTLTYADRFLPADGSVSVRETQLFFKRLRRRVADRLRYFVCGEYGDQLGRPHYHAIIFGYGFPDRYVWRRTDAGHTVWRSSLLEEVWPFGLCEIGSVTHESAGYVARYCLKKVTGKGADAAYLRPHPVTGVEYRVNPAFAAMSRNPGIGSGWYDQFSVDCFPSDFLVVDGRKVPVPRYYSKKLEGNEALKLVAERKADARLDAEDSTPERLAVREGVTYLRTSTLKRSLE